MSRKSILKRSESSILNILYFQVAAALLMGWDYFTPTSWREHMNRVLAQYFGQVQSRVDHGLAGAWAYIKVSATRIFAALVSFGLAYAVIKGPMSGLGFLSLLVSFVMQYINYKAT